MPNNIIGGGNSIMSKAGIVDGIYNASVKDDSIMMNSTARNNSITGSNGENSKFRS